mgnify:CR=1 FL=1
MPSTLVLLVILLPWVGALFVRLAGMAHPRLLHGLAIAFSASSALCALLLIRFNSPAIALAIPMGGPFGDFSFVADGLGILLSLIATVIGTLAVIFSVDYMAGDPQLDRYYSFVLLFIGAMAGLVLSNNLLVVFFFWEITALCSYALISFYNDDPKAVKAGIKALIMTQVGGVGLMAMALLLFSYAGSYDISRFLANPSVLPPAALAVMAFGALAAAAAKSAQVPFHTWLPDAMEAPTPVSALIHAATMVNAGVYLLARFYPAFAGVAYWREAVMVIGMLSALLAGIMALVTYDLKRILAYSTISQLGFMVYAVGAGGILASQFHLLSHAIFKGLLFLCAGAIIHALGTRDVREMGSEVGKQMPLVRAVFVIGALALAGIPALNGFWSKDLVLEAGLAGGPPWIFTGMLLVVGLTAFYTFRCVWLTFYAPSSVSHHAHDAPTAMRVALIPLALGALTSWLLVGPMSSLLQASLPFHPIEPLSLANMIGSVLSNPWTWGTLAIVALGLVAWWQRDALRQVGWALRGIASSADHSFGFEAINRAITSGTVSLSEGLRGIQTGLFNWNALAIVGTLFILLLILLVRGG